MFSQKDHIDHLESSLIYGNSLDIVDDEAQEYVFFRAKQTKVL